MCSHQKHASTIYIEFYVLSTFLHQETGHIVKQGIQKASISQDSAHLGCLCFNYLDHQWNSFLESLGSVDQVPLNWDFNCSANPLQVPNLIKGTLLLHRFDLKLQIA